jgi:hypothetical protein
MGCQLFRENGKITKILAVNEKPSKLYKEILEEVKAKGTKSFIDNIAYLRDRLADGTLLDDSVEEIAAGLWSIAYSPEYQTFFNNITKQLTGFADENGEPIFAVFKNSVLNDNSQYNKASIGSVLDPERAAFTNESKKKGNALQQRIVQELIEKPENAVFLEPKEHVYYDEYGEVYTSITTGIKGKLDDNDRFANSREIGNSVDKLLQGIILGKNFVESSEGISNIEKPVLKTIFAALQVYVDSLTKDGSIVVTQAAFGDKFSKRAGSLDLLVINPQGKMKIVDLKTSKNSVKTEKYDEKYPVKDGSVFPGERLSTRQQHGIQVGAYKKLIELKGFEVSELHTVHLKVDLDKNDKVEDITWEGEVRHHLSINKDYVDKLIPTDIDTLDRTAEIKKELGMDNPADDPDFLDTEESKPEQELYGDMYDRMYAGAKKVIDLFETRRKYLDKIKKGKTYYDKNIMIDKINELVVMMGVELQNDRPSVAYGAFVRHATNEIKDYLKEITNKDNFKDPGYISLLLEVDKYIESYRGIVNVKGVGSREQQQMFLEMLDLLDDTKEAIDTNLAEYVKDTIKERTSRNLTEKELDDIMKNVYDIKYEDYHLGDLATSTDTLLAIADKIYKEATNKATDATEATSNRLMKIGNALLKAAGLSKPVAAMYDFMKVMNKEGKFTGRYVGRVGQQYYEMYYALKNKTKEKNGENKQYIPILDPAKANDDDINYNMALFRDKKNYREFMNAEIIGPDGADDGKFHKYSDNFKAIRSKYQELVSYPKPDGTLFYKWEKIKDISHEEYEQFRLKYFNEAEYWGPDFENDGTFKGKVTLKKNWFVKNEHVEIRDIAENGLDMRDPKYVKLMNPKTELEKAQSNFYKEWTQEYEGLLEKLPPEVASQMRGKVGRVRASFMENLKKSGEGMTKAVAKSMKNFFTSEVYSEQRLVDELGHIEQGLPIMYVGKLRNEGRVEFLKKELNGVKQKYSDRKLSKKEYTDQKSKLQELIKIEENKISTEEIEGDLVQNLMTFASMAENYEIMSGIESDLQAIAKVMEDREYYETNSVGKKLIRAGSKISKDDEGTPVVKRSEDVLATKRLRKWFKMVYYNNQEFNKSTVAMVAKRVQNLTSLKGVGFNIFGNVNNYVMGRINNSIETAGALYYDRTAANRAVGDYNKEYLPGLFKGLGNKDGEYYADKKPNSKYEAMVEKFRMIKHYQSGEGDSPIGKAIGWGYAIQQGGEYNVQSKTGVAILMSKQIKNTKTGETLSVYDAFNFDPNTGELKLQDGFELSDKDRYQLTNYILEVNKQIHGNYAPEDRMVIQEGWIGQLAAQFHKWVYPAYKVRFKERYVDENLGTIEGRYVTVYNFLKYIKEAEGGFLEKFRTGWKNMDAVQVKNMYKNLAELGFLAASFAMYGIFKALADGVDKDDKTLKRWLNFMSFQQSRQMQELVTLMPIVGTKEQYQLAKSPVAILTTLKDFGEAVQKTMSLPFPPYEKNYYTKGVYKGDLKAWKEWKDVIPALNVLNKWQSYDQVSSFYIK